MDTLFSKITLADTHRVLIRNVVSLRESEDLFDDLSDRPEEWQIAQQVELDAKPHPYRSNLPEINRPFEEAIWFNVIAWPFKNWQASRFSDGSFGVWYGSDRVETTVYESACHWFRGLICDAGFENEAVVIERKLYRVACDALLLDFRQVVQEYPDLLHKSDYSFTHAVGSRIHREGHPGMLTLSARHKRGLNYAILNPGVLSNPRHHSNLTYRLDGKVITVEKNPGVAWMEIDRNQL